MSRRDIDHVIAVLTEQSSNGLLVHPQYVAALLREVARLRRIADNAGATGGMLQEIDFLGTFAKHQHGEYAPKRDYDEWLTEERNMWLWRKNNPDWEMEEP